jgi:hypothetical protein
MGAGAQVTFSATDKFANQPFKLIKDLIGLAGIASEPFHRSEADQALAAKALTYFQEAKSATFKRVSMTRFADDIGIDVKLTGCIEAANAPSCWLNRKPIYG